MNETASPNTEQSNPEVIALDPAVAAPPEPAPAARSVEQTIERVLALLDRHPLAGGALGMGAIVTVIAALGLPATALGGVGGYLTYRHFRKGRGRAAKNVAGKDAVAGQ